MHRLVHAAATALFRLLLAVLTAPARRPRPPGRRSLADAGMSTAEYAVGTVAAVGFAIVLWGVAHGATVHDLLAGMVRRALTMPT